MSKRFLLALLALAAAACSNAAPQAPAAAATSAPAEPKKYLLERVDDAAIVQLYADGFSALPLKDKTLIWHLTQAAIAGRDIFYDQRYRYNLEMREVLEAILANPSGVDTATLKELQRYAKLFWINTGPYNNLTAQKFVLGVTPEALASAAKAAASAGAKFPVANAETLDQLLTRLKPMFFDAAFEPSVTKKQPPPGQDILTASFNNLYQGVSLKDVTGFAERYPLNSRLVKRDGKLVEEVYKIGGRYDPQLKEVVAHLEAAIPFASEPMAKALRALAQWYRTGEAADRRTYDIAWVEDKASPVDTINGFTEVYLDARGVKGSWEGVVFYVNQQKTADIQKLAREAQWFEDHMPWDPK